MKKLYLVALVLLGFTAKAQYFSHLYGDKAQRIFNTASGLNTLGFNYGGHAMVSMMERTAGNPAGALVVATDVNGTPLFNNVYTVYKAGVDLGNWENHIFEWDHATNLGVVGLLKLHNREGVFYMRLDQFGNFIGIDEYIVSPPPASSFPWYVKSVTNIAESIDGHSLYVTGLASRPYSINGSANAFILKIDIASGALLWSQIYEFGYTDPSGGSQQYPYDIIESPFTPSGTQEVVIIGQYRDVGSSLPSDEEGFFLRVDASNGIPLANVLRYNSTVYSASAEVFKTITVSNSLASGSQGFILAGISTEGNMIGTYQDMWSLKVDPTGSMVMWQNLYSSAALDNDECYDVIERLNPNTWNYEYFYAGSRGAGHREALLIKTDDLGNVFPNGEMNYFINMTEAHQLDKTLDSPNGSMGLTVFGTDFDNPFGAGQTLMLNVYFNLVLGCGENIYTPVTNPGPGFTGSTSVTIVSDFMKGGFLPVAIRPSIDNPVCFNTSVPGGSNARVAPAEPQGDKEAIVSPNPIQQGSAVAMVEVESYEPATVQIAVYDMLGKQYVAGSYTLIKGKNQLPVDLSTANMAAGMYTVKITGTAINQNILLVVK